MVGAVQDMRLRYWREGQSAGEISEGGGSAEGGVSDRHVGF